MLVVGLWACVASEAGIFSRHLSGKNLAGIHRVAVVSLVGTEVHLDKIGILVAADVMQVVSLPQWQMDMLIADGAVRQIESGARFQATALALAPGEIDESPQPLSTDSRRALLERARAQGADTLLVIKRIENSQDRRVEGVGVENRKLLSHDQVSLMASLILLVVRVEDDTILATSMPDPLHIIKHAWPNPSQWQVMASDQQAEWETLIRANVTSQVEKSLSSLGLVP